MNDVICEVCKDLGWVCEDHQDQPWDDEHQKDCGPGMPCKCNTANHPWAFGFDKPEEML